MNINRIARAGSDVESRLETNEKDLEVLESNQVFTEEDDEIKFSHTKIILQRAPHFFFYATTSARYRKARAPSHPIPRTHIYPLLPTLAPNPLPPNVFLKRPSLTSYADSARLTEISALFTHEAQMCELIKRSPPHRNVARYFGCLIDEHDGRISALCFARYGKTLYQVVRDGESVDRRACLDGIRAGIEHLHSLGVIHCDVNPHNVFTDGEGGFVLGDFDSCALEGDELGAKAGTDGWTSEEFVLARRENDWFGFAKIELFLSSSEKEE